MTTPLIFYPLNATSTTIPTAVALVTSSGVSTTSSPTTPIGTSTRWGEIALSGDSLAWASSGTEPAPTGAGACLDGSTLLGQQILAGNWNGAFKLFAGTIGASYTGTLKLRAWRYNSLFETYTTIGGITLTSQTFDHSGEVFVFPATSFGAPSFPTVYDTAYIDLVFNCLVNTGSTSTSKVKVNISSSATLGSTGNSFFATPGYIPQKQLAGRFLLSTPHKLLASRFAQQVPHLTLPGRFLLSRPHKLLASRFGLAPGGNRLPSRARLAAFQDSFLRANTAGSTSVGSAAGWGTTLDGNTWSGSGSAYTTQISSNRGTITGSTGSWHATLGGFLVADGDLFVRFSLSNTTARAGLSFRSPTGSVNNEYRARYNNGAFEIVKVVTGTGTVLATTAFTLTANTAYWVHANVSGNTLSANLWVDGTSEPGGYMLSVTDPNWTYVNGLAGVVTNNVATGDTTTFDHFVATTQNTTRTTVLASRLRLAASSSPQLAARFRLKSQVKSKKLKGRFILVKANTYPLASRFNLADTNPAIEPPVGGASLSYLGGNDVPVNPAGYYTVNHQVLDTQPIICTGPESVAGNVLVAGSIFTLVFDAPSIFTRSLLVDGTQVTMQFAIPSGQMITGSVQIASSLSISSSNSYALRLYGADSYGTGLYGLGALLPPRIGNTLVVVCTLTQDVTISTLVITTSFF